MESSQERRRYDHHVREGMSYMCLYMPSSESDDSDNEASSSKKKKKNSCTLVWEVSSNRPCDNNSTKIL